MRNATINLEHGRVTVTISLEEDGSVVMSGISRPLTGDEMRQLADFIDFAHDDCGWNPDVLPKSVLIEWHNVNA